MNKMHFSRVAIVCFVACETILFSGTADALPLLENLKARVKDSIKIQEEKNAALDLRSVDRTVGIGTKLQEKFCSGFGDAIANMNVRLADTESKIRERRDAREENLTSRWENQDGELMTLRTEQDTRREEWYAKLLTGDLSDTQRKAVGTFRETVDAAVEDRRDSVDKANETFREAVGNLSTRHQGTLDGLVGDFRSSVDAAVAAAKRSCDDGKDAKTIRTDFRTAIDAAKTTLKNGRDKQIGIGADVSALAKTRNVEIQKAMDTFKSALTAATVELKKAILAGE